MGLTLHSWGNYILRPTFTWTDFTCSAFTCTAFTCTAFTCSPIMCFSFACPLFITSSWNRFPWRLSWSSHVLSHFLFLHMALCRRRISFWLVTCLLRARLKHDLSRCLQRYAHWEDLENVPLHVDAVSASCLFEFILRCRHLQWPHKEKQNPPWWVSIAFHADGRSLLLLIDLFSLPGASFRLTG